MRAAFGFENIFLIGVSDCQSANQIDVDGGELSREAVTFLKAIKEYIEKPARILWEV